MDVPLGRWRGVAGNPVRATHQDPALQQPGQLGFAVERDRQVRQGPKRDHRYLTGARTGSVHDHVGPVPLRNRASGRGQLRVADPARAVRLGGGLERPDERHHAAQRDLDVPAPGQLEHRERVLDDLLRFDVAGAARHREQLDFRRGARVQEGEAVVDAGVDVEQQRNVGGHGRES
jgi:hypothetical protein